MKLITNENKVSGLHYCMHIKLHLLMWYHSESVLIQSCKVYILTFFYLTVKCNSFANNWNTKGFCNETWRTLFKEKDKLYICGTLIVKNVKVRALLFMTYLLSSESGEEHQPCLYCWRVNWPHKVRFIFT